MATETAQQAGGTAFDDDFAAMLEETFVDGRLTEGSVVKGTVIGVESDTVLIDVGLKAEGRVPLKEFGGPGRAPEIHVGDIVDVYLERMEVVYSLKFKCMCYQQISRQLSLRQ